MITFEITLKGFDGDTDNTGHLVKWVNAPNLAALEKWLYETSLDDFLFCEPRNLIKSGCAPKGAGREDGVSYIFGEAEEDTIEGWKKQSREAQGVYDENDQ